MDDEDTSHAVSRDGRDEDDEEDYEENDGGNRLLGFMFGNVDNSGDLDVDYLDEDAKEHLSALADKLGASLTDIDLSKSSPGPMDASEQDYDEKADDAIDYEDIDEQYDGPEIQASTEEDHLLKKDYYSSDTLLASLDQKGSVFDEENYDEDEETMKETEAVENTIEVLTSAAISSGEQLETAPDTDVHGTSPDGSLPSAVSPEAGHMVFELEDFQEQSNTEQELGDSRSETPLPVLCVEDGKAILKFSEIFGIHEPLKKIERKDHNTLSVSKERIKAVDFDVEEDEMAFLRSSYHNLPTAKHFSSVNELESDLQHEISDDDEELKDSCLSSQPMKDYTYLDTIACRWSPLSPKFYPLDQQDWEDAIVWGNSPSASHGCSESSVISELDADANIDIEKEVGLAQKNMEVNKGSHNLFVDTALVEPFGSRRLTYSACQSVEKNYHPQLLRLESTQRENNLCSVEMENENLTGEVRRGDMLRRFNKLSLQNKDMIDGSWLDQVIWDPDEAIPKPKLILDLQDEQMLFEVLDHKDSEHLHSHAGAMVMMQSSKLYVGEFSENHNQGMSSVGRFNISNDKYYSNRKISQQVKSHAKKRSLNGIKVMHSAPALKLQTMKPKLSNKDIANFHRPKALWYPHDNEIIAKEQGMPCTSGPMKIIIASLGGGKGIKLQVNAKETLSTIKFRASKKLEFRPSEKVKVLYSGKELEDDQPLAQQNVRPNSVLHLVRTRVHVWPRAQKLPGDNKPLRPPGAFKKKSDLSVKDGHVFLMEYCEERPLLLGNVGMGARLCTYFQKRAPGDPTPSSLRNVNAGFGTVLPLEPSDKSPFLGDIGPGCSQSCLETNMYRAPIFPHKSSSTDYLLVRSAKGMLSLRRIDKLYSVGQQEPHMDVLSPGPKTIQTYLVNRMLVYVYRAFRTNEKPDNLPSIRVDDLAAQFPGLTDAIVRKRLKHCADIKRSNGVFLWVKRHDFRIPLEEVLRRMLTPENVCSYESMQAGIYHLKRLGISRLTHPVGLSPAMNQLPDEAIALAAASHIERELQITPWNLTSNFVACTSQDKENIERLEITGVGDPSGRGLGFSYVRVTPKAPVSSAMMKKKAASAKIGSTVTGTDADLRRLSMDAAREVLLKFNVPDEQIDKLTRWHRIALVRKLSSEQAASGVKVDAMTLSKFARGQRMSFLQLQQQTREKCQEIWDRQVQSLSAGDGDEMDSDTEANSDLDSFAGDLENLLDAEEFEEEEDVNRNLKGDKTDVVRGLKMRRCSSQAQLEEDIEDDKAEAAMLRRLLEDDPAEIKKKKFTSKGIGQNSQLGSENVVSSKKAMPIDRHNLRTPNLDGPSTSMATMMRESKVEKLLAERSLPGKLKPRKLTEKNDDVLFGIVNKKTASTKESLKIFKEKKQVERPTRESFVCGACGQHGHMRTNKNCPKYGEDAETSELEIISSKSFNSDALSQQLKTPGKKSIPKVLVKVSEAEVPEGSEKATLKSSSKVIPLKFKCGSSDKLFNRSLSSTQAVDKQTIVSAEMETKPIKVSKLIISNKTKPEDFQYDTPKPSIVIRPPVDVEKDQPCKKIIIKQPKAISEVDQVEAHDIGMGYEFRKTKKITELSNFDRQKKQESRWFSEEDIRGKAIFERRLRDEEEKRSKQRIAEERNKRILEESMVDQQRSIEMGVRYGEAMWREEPKSKKNKKKKKKPDLRDEYLLEPKPYRIDFRRPERDRASKRRTVIDSGQLEYAPPIKRRRGAEVMLSNILESIVDSLKEHVDISYLFLKPVTKKEAPDYFDIVERPMDLSTIRDKVRSMEYKSREEFRHDVWQITYNAHVYNDGRNPGIPPLADQLLELCDYLLQEKDDILSEAETGIDKHL